MPQPSQDGTLPEELVERVTSRLRAVCSSIPEPEFSRLVQDVVTVKLKYDGDHIAEQFQTHGAQRTG